MTRIKAVTFDLWQTLLLDNREQGRARAQVRLEGAQKALLKRGFSFDLEHIREAYRACYRRCRRIREDNVDISFREQVEIFINFISEGLVDRLDEETISAIVRPYADSFFVFPPALHEDAASVLQEIKGQGLSIGLISNTGMTPGSTFREFLEQHRVLDFFDVMTFSDEVRLAKPSDEIFLMTLRDMDAAPQETVHVGDHVLNDVVGAKRCGLKTVWITGFYENENPEDQETHPDATVADLGQVPQAVAQLAVATG